MYEATRRYYDDHADLVVELLGRSFNVALISRAEDLATCIAEDFRYIVDNAGIADGQAVLECGSGNGDFCRRLLERFPGLQYRGIDLSARQVAIARAANPGVEFREGRFEELDCAPASFDRALFLETIGYCVDLDGLLQRLHRALRPGGRVFVKNPGQKITDYHDFLQHAEYFDPVRREYGYDDRSLGIIPDIDLVVRKFGLAGFALVHEEYPYFDEYWYNRAFYAAEVCRPVRRPDKTTPAFDFSRFDPGTSLSALGRCHPANVDYHRRMSTGLGYPARNWLTGCAVLVFEKAPGASNG